MPQGIRTDLNDECDEQRPTINKFYPMLNPMTKNEYTESLENSERRRIINISWEEEYLERIKELEEAWFSPEDDWTMIFYSDWVKLCVDLVSMNYYNLN